ncbi:unnamed protein product [Phytophthora fragariaefolia]|uniref:Unnamed protein product n=1 Tax=Phytophthora fragariaefolia TaxID=1490495 RepID=A0A9W6XBZ6_9STRA|nr:unnamed protein product [Phytophthora fragariaefolia]
MEEKQEVGVVEPIAATNAKTMESQVEVDDIHLDVNLNHVDFSMQAGHETPSRRQSVNSAPVSPSTSPTGRKASVSLMTMGPPLKILVASWNVGNTMPPKDSKLLSDWIPEGGDDYDVIAVGLQESTYKNEKVSENLVRTDSWRNASSKAEDQDEEETDMDPPLDSVVDGTEVEEGEEDEEDEEYESEGKIDELGNRSSIRRSGVHKSSSTTDENNSPSSEAIRTSRAGGQFNSSTSEQNNGSTIGPNKSSDVIVKRSRTKKSMRKMTRMVRQLSSNLRDTMGDALDYPFSKQIYLHLGESYVLAGKVELMEMRLFIYVHERNNVCDVEKLAVPTGLGSVIGNKVPTPRVSSVIVGPSNCTVHLLP